MQERSQRLIGKRSAWLYNAFEMVFGQKMEASEGRVIRKDRGGICGHKHDRIGS
jgi:hypothetical protein